MSARVLFERRCPLRRRRLAAACLFAGTSPLAFREEAKTWHRAHGDTESTEKRGERGQRGIRAPGLLRALRVLCAKSFPATGTRRHSIIPGTRGRGRG